MGQDRSLIRKAKRNSFSGPKSWVGQHLRESQGRQSVIRLMETHIWCPLSRGGLRKETMAYGNTYVGKKAAVLALILIPDNSVPPHMSLLTF